MPCAEPCEWNCEHLKCTTKCGELCNRPPCNEPCPKRLHCGHSCIGLCGEKCPQLCRVCDEGKVTEIFLGSEDEPDARFVELQDCNHMFEYSDLDRWMKEQDGEIQFKKCPRCNTPIRTSLRYCNHVKKVHNDFEQVKQMQLNVSKDTPELSAKLQAAEKKAHYCEEVTGDLNKIKSLIHPKSKPQYILPHMLSAIQTQLNMLPAIAKIYGDLTQVRHKMCWFGNCKVTAEVLHQNVQCLQEFLRQESLTDQQLNDIDCELRRLQCASHLFDLHSKIREREVVITHQESGLLDMLARKVYHSGAGQTPKMSDDLEREVSALVTHFKQQYSLEGLTQAERTEIVQAVGLSKGHWFKCRNGHFYCIGECGGATEETKCPECDARIGGAHHTLRSDNQLAPEMDGAQHAAWSNAANMGNYNLDDF